MRHSSMFGRVLPFVFVVIAGCGGPSEYAVTGTERAAGADGTVMVERIEGGNYLVTLDLEHLPPPDRLGSGLTTYVVWFVPENAQATMAGRLEYDADERTGQMRATTPLTNFDVTITAERADAVGSPGEVVVMRRRVE